MYISGFVFQIMCNDNDSRNSITASQQFEFCEPLMHQIQKREQNKKEEEKKKRVAANFRQKGAASCNPW